MNEKQLASALKILDLIIDYGIPAGQAIYRTIKALYGADLTEEQMAEKLIWLSQDSHVRAELAKADAAGNG